MKVGILGGSFNPIHNGHIKMAEYAYRDYGLDYVSIIPAGIPPHKSKDNMVSDHHRINMINLAILDKPMLKLDTRELDSNEISYTYLTLSNMKAENPQNELYFIMGGDSLAYFKNWFKTDIIMSKAHILVAVRDDLDLTKLEPYRQELLELYSGDISYLTMPKEEVSSSDIRRLIKEGSDLSNFLPDNIINYISDNKLYME